ncbi:MAG: hypothetical protein KKB51_10355 [Candidatus Riflebacteria bacterium]|nr:hypothetical protein [Candidatus Riflebacteria bacterium]
MNKRNRIISRGKRAGIVLFVVLGGIFILTILILSYNHLVRGKFNESQELLKHLRAMKCAQSISRYIISKMKADLIDTNTDASSPGQVLRTAFKQNSESVISNSILSDWMSKIGLNDLLSGLTSNQSFVARLLYNVDVSQVKSLDDGNGFYLDYEKSGQITISVEVEIDKATEKWQETRPFRVIMPFPLPITKFNLYLRDAAGGDDTKFNTVIIATPETGKVITTSPRPLILTNGEPTNSSTPEDIWKNRGWIYMGGSETLLNRAGGSKEFGQNYHSYFPSAAKPITLVFNFGPWPIGSRNVVFSVARWGFADTVCNGPDSLLWQSVLKPEFSKFPLTAASHWASTWLHLFGESPQGSSASKISHTRVIGDVKDRYLEVCYLADSATKVPVGAVRALSSADYNTARSSGPSIPGMSALFVKTKLIESDVPPALSLQEFIALEPLFLAIPWLTTDGSVCYYTIMSKIDNCSYSETYDMIAQYTSTNQKVDIPPSAAAPLTSDKAFQLPIEGIDTRNIEIDKIAAVNDPTLGLTRRICYEVKAEPAPGKGAFEVLQENFCYKQTSLNLGNAVLRVVTGGVGMTIVDGIGRHTGGNIIVDGPVTVGSFDSSDPSVFDPPLMIMAEKGAITVNNGGSNSTLAYLVALGNGGEIKCSKPNLPMNLVGGIAAHTLDPSKMAGGGNLIYNTFLDPTDPAFTKKYVGVVIGPPGGNI